ncbi:hypothetical protein ABIA33_001682 [Streptacidiphilus sp. MAP12-16]|uniref:hypothetical protein n=1 Tax=Streptacidiphilus sp. MAP12-16 TaxID=3156300 RepID=UPI003518275E
MMPRSNPVKVPSYLRGDADAETLAGLVHTSRRMRKFWPLLAVDEPHTTPGRRTGFQVSSRSASLVKDLSEYGD